MATLHMPLPDSDFDPTKAASRGAQCEITDIASCSRRRPAGRHVPIRKW